MIMILLKMMTMPTKLFCIRLANFHFFFIFRGDDVKITMFEEDVYNTMMLLNTMSMIVLTMLFCILMITF